MPRSDPRQLTFHAALAPKLKQVEHCGVEPDGGVSELYSVTVSCFEWLFVYDVCVCVSSIIVLQMLKSGNMQKMHESPSSSNEQDERTN